MTLVIVFLIAAIIAFGLAAFGLAARGNFVAAGAAFVTGALLVHLLEIN